jgi:hypothetical protein
MTQLLASPDERHKNEAIWDQIRATGVLTVYTRPRNLTEEQKKQRCKESNLRRLKYATELNEKRKGKRIEKLFEGRQLVVQTSDWEAEARANTALAAAELETPTALPAATETPRAMRGRGR